MLFDTFFRLPDTFRLTHSHKQAWQVPSRAEYVSGAGFRELLMKHMHHMLIRMTRSCAMENSKLCYLIACVVVLCFAMLR